MALSDVVCRSFTLETSSLKNLPAPSAGDACVTAPLAGNALPMPNPLSIPFICIQKPPSLKSCYHACRELFTDFQRLHGHAFGCLHRHHVSLVGAAGRDHIRHLFNNVHVGHGHKSLGVGLPSGGGGTA